MKKSIMKKVKPVNHKIACHIKFSNMQWLHFLDTPKNHQLYSINRNQVNIRIIRPELSGNKVWPYIYDES